VHAQARKELNASLNESVLMVPKKAPLQARGTRNHDVQTQRRRAFPARRHQPRHCQTGNPRLQARYRPAVAARYFMQRGYVVLVPMRQGFSKSSGITSAAAAM
jgi:hypothetical protein